MVPYLVNAHTTEYQHNIPPPPPALCPAVPATRRTCHKQPCRATLSSPVGPPASIEKGISARSKTCSAAQHSTAQHSTVQHGVTQQQQAQIYISSALRQTAANMCKAACSIQFMHSSCCSHGCGVETCDAMQSVSPAQTSTRNSGFAPTPSIDAAACAGRPPNRHTMQV